MKRLAVIAALTLTLIAPTTATVRADEEARAANTFLAATVADTLTTQRILNDPRGRENNPLAKPYERRGELALSLGTTLVLNGLLRLVLHGHTNAPKVYRTLTLVESAFVVNNVVVLDYQWTHPMPSQSFIKVFNPANTYPTPPPSH